MNKRLKSEPLALMVNLITDREYIHLNFYVVRWEDRKIRNIGDRAINGFHRLNDLQITSQGQQADRSAKLYGWDIRYISPYSVDYRDAEKMYRTLRKILERLDKIIVKRGYAKTYGDYVGRFAEVVGATEILYSTGRATSSFDDGTYRRMNLGEGVEYIDRIVRDWQNGGEMKLAQVSNLEVH